MYVNLPDCSRGEVLLQNLRDHPLTREILVAIVGGGATPDQERRL